MIFNSEQREQLQIYYNRRFKASGYNTVNGIVFDSTFYAVVLQLSRGIVVILEKRKDKRELLTMELINNSHVKRLSMPV